jgi:stage II sporulation protein D
VKLAVFISLIMAILPLAAAMIFIKPKAVTTAKETIITENIYTVPENIRIKDGDEIYTMPIRDYVIGAVMAEMPAAFHPEALKAQAAAIYSFAIRQTVIGADETFDVSSDSATYIRYFTEAKGRAFYTDGYNAAYEKIAAAVDSVLGYVIVFEDEPIAAAYFSCSPGRTERASNVWISDLPYLQPVSSDGDVNAPVYQETKIFTAAEIAARLKTEADIDFDGEIKILKRSDSKTVLEVNIGGRVIDGQTFRKILNLKSGAFYIDEDNGKYRITTLGYGHFVGMSQYGAQYMAEKGISWREIIEHYYTGVTIAKTKTSR